MDAIRAQEARLEWLSNTITELEKEFTQSEALLYQDVRELAARKNNFDTEEEFDVWIEGLASNVKQFVAKQIARRAQLDQIKAELDSLAKEGP